MPKPRRSGFRIGTVHGKSNPRKRKSEAQLQRDVFLRGSLALIKSSEKSKQEIVRIVGYEVPLSSAKRSGSIDLVGYDRHHRLYLIELKRGKSTEKIAQIVAQLQRYDQQFATIRDGFVEELKTAYHFDFVPKDKVQLMILAPREFWTRQEKNIPVAQHAGIDCTYFRIKDVKTLRSGHGPVSVHFRKFKLSAATRRHKR